MTFAEYRQSRSLSLEQCCRQLGLAPSSKGHLSRLENGALPFGLRLALEIEVWSAGEVRALDLLPKAEAALLRAAQLRAAAA